MKETASLEGSAKIANGSRPASGANLREGRFSWQRTRTILRFGRGLPKKSILARRASFLIPPVAILFAAATSVPAAAHEFTVAIVGSNSLAAEQVAEIARGFIVATDERDGHANETSDGHLGGIDVQVRVLPQAAATLVEGLVGTPGDPADIALLLGPQGSLGGSTVTLGPDTIVFQPGRLPPADTWDANGFGSRFAALFGRPPTEGAAQGYNAARRIDLAIRALDGLRPKAAVEAALASSEAGIEW